MSKAETKKRSRELIEILNYHNHLYHNLDRPEITDREYDKLFDELLQIEAQYPDLLTQESPTQKVGGTTLDKFQKVKHKLPMLSLQNTYNEEEIQQFEEKILKQLQTEDKYVQFFCAPKFDGIAMELIYEKGILTQALTRGDGQTGENVFNNVRTIKSLPLKLITKKPPRYFEARGEVLIFKDDFARINRDYEQNGESTFANPRNAAGGTLRQLDSNIAARRPLQFFSYAPGFLEDMSFKDQKEFEDFSHSVGLPTISMIPENKKYSDMTKIFKLKKYNSFRPPLSQICKGTREVIEYYKFINSIRPLLPFEIDGIVVKVNSYRLQEELGFVARSPRWAFASKFEPEQVQTTVNNIIVQIGRTGALTPVAIMEPASVGGVTITHATLHNQDEINRKDVRKGDTVLIHRAGDVIPEVIQVVQEKRKKNSKPFTIPNQCPSCKTTAVQPEGEAIKRCPNSLCPAVMKEALKHFASRNAMNIEKLGDRLIETLFDEGLVTKFSDFYILKKEDLLKLERQAEKSATNIIQSISTSQNVEFSRFIYSLGIRFVGEQTAKALAKKLKTLERLIEVTEEELIAIDDVGPRVATSIIDAFSQKIFIKELKQIVKNGVMIQEEERTQMGDQLVGLTFVITGSFHISRGDIKKNIEAHGGKVSGSVSKKTNYLIAGAEAGSKLNKAQGLGIQVLDWDGYQNLI